MSLFADPSYDYWQSHINFIWSIRDIPIGNQLLAILDQRARRLLLVFQQLSSNPNIQISATQFSSVPVGYEDLQVITYLSKEYLAIRLEIINYNIIYLP